MQADNLTIRNPSSIRYQKKLTAKMHSIKIHDVCGSDCSKNHIDHQLSVETDEYEEDDEYHPDIHNILSKEIVFLHQWHRRLYE